MKEFPFPALSLVKKINEGQLDAVMFEEMQLQKCEEYCGDKIIDANENSELYKGLLSFMIVGLKENVPYVIKFVPEPNIGWS